MQKFIVIALVVLCGGVALADPGNPMQKIVDDCNKENSVSAEEMQKFVTGKLAGTVTKDNLKCSVHCVMSKSGFLNESGKLNVDAVRKAWKEEDTKKYEHALENCKDVSGMSPCETAFLIAECLMENNVPLR